MYKIFDGSVCPFVVKVDPDRVSVFKVLGMYILEHANISGNHKWSLDLFLVYNNPYQVFIGKHESGMFTDYTRCLVGEYVEGNSILIRPHKSSLEYVRIAEDIWTFKTASPIDLYYSMVNSIGWTMPYAVTEDNTLYILTREQSLMIQNIQDVDTIRAYRDANRHPCYDLFILDLQIGNVSPLIIEKIIIGRWLQIRTSKDKIVRS